MIVALYEPEIPPNTGNIARLCAAFDTALHLVGPLGFKLEDRYLKRAGLDYWPHVDLHTWTDWDSFKASLSARTRIVCLTTHASVPLQEFRFLSEDLLLFGPETRGLPASVLSDSPLHVRIPVRRMEEGGVRSLNLSSACAIVLYAALLDSGLLGSFS